MSNVWFGGASEALSSVHDPSLASFVERAVASAVVSPESRQFASAWSSVAKSQGASSPESLIALLHSKLVVTDATATLDVAWLNERLVEIATQVDSLSEGISINFSKRRWMFNTVRNALAISQPSSELSGDVLQQLERRLEGWGSWSQRVLRDVASGEGTKVTKSVKPFSRLVVQQQEKVRRDKASRELVSKGQKLEQQGRLQREKEVAKAMDKSVSVRTRRMTSLFHFGRPVSTMNPSAPSPPLPAVAPPSPQALQSLRDWSPTGKPYLVLTLSGVEVQPYDNSQRSFVFELSTEDGQRSLFQAPSREELRNWVSHFKKSGTQIAFRRATFLAQTALAEEPEEVIAATAKTTRNRPPASNARESPSYRVRACETYDLTALLLVFYVPLWELLQREKTNVPRFVEKALEVIEGRGQSCCALLFVRELTATNFRTLGSRHLSHFGREQGHQRAEGVAQPRRRSFYAPCDYRRSQCHGTPQVLPTRAPRASHPLRPLRPFHHGESDRRLRRAPLRHSRSHLEDASAQLSAHAPAHRAFGQVSQSQDG